MKRARPDNDQQADFVSESKINECDCDTVEAELRKVEKRYEWLWKNKRLDFMQNPEGQFAIYGETGWHDTKEQLIDKMMEADPK